MTHQLVLLRIVRDELTRRSPASARILSFFSMEFLTWCLQFPVRPLNVLIMRRAKGCVAEPVALTIVLIGRSGLCIFGRHWGSPGRMLFVVPPELKTFPLVSR